MKTGPEGLFLPEHETSGKFLPAFFVDVVELGEEFPSGELPLHMTYFPPVKAPLTRKGIAEARRFINPMEPFSAQVGEDALFGDAHDVPVKLIESTPRLVAVHRKLVDVFGNLSHDPRYRMPYRPHVTVGHDSSSIQTGDSIEIAGLSIVEKDPRTDVWTVMAKIGLKGAQR